MPIGPIAREPRKRPDDSCPGQTRRDVRILNDIDPVIVIYELIMAHGPIHSEGHRDQQEAKDNRGLVQLSGHEPHCVRRMTACQIISFMALLMDCSLPLATAMRCRPVLQFAVSILLWLPIAPMPHQPVPRPPP